MGPAIHGVLVLELFDHRRKLAAQRDPGRRVERPEGFPLPRQCSVAAREACLDGQDDLFAVQRQLARVFAHTFEAVPKRFDHGVGAAVEDAPSCLDLLEPVILDLAVDRLHSDTERANTYYQQGALRPDDGGAFV